MSGHLMREPSPTGHLAGIDRDISHRYPYVMELLPLSVKTI